MWICSLDSVLWHRLVETGNDDLPAALSLEKLGLISMLFVAKHGLKLFATLHCKNYFNVIIAAKTKDDARF